MWHCLGLHILKCKRNYFFLYVVISVALNKLLVHWTHNSMMNFRTRSSLVREIFFNTAEIELILFSQRNKWVNIIKINHYYTHFHLKRRNLLKIHSMLCLRRNSVALVLLASQQVNNLVVSYNKCIFFLGCQTKDILHFGWTVIQIIWSIKFIIKWIVFWNLKMKFRISILLCELIVFEQLNLQIYTRVFFSFSC